MMCTKKSTICVKMQKKNLKVQLMSVQWFLGMQNAREIVITMKEIPKHHLFDQLKSRFLDHRELLSKIQNILPTKCSELTTEEIVLTVKTFRKEWPNDIEGSDEDLESDITMWRRHCSNTPEEKRPKTFINALNFCESTLYQSVHRFLKIRATFPVSVASSERSFSCFRRLKICLRNKTAEDR
ncbi:hypothetical protein AGLY_015849 [Aphis glycines]|uniref:HAT C-terminal dimerisation domain-containing protein n=1 Tax=Aphis glycines TaxID=307491 RepID=A0A6G0SZN5_APHGL|nr:hypothetical protein AGLY_015849 [Aphis glycines]